MAWFKGGTPPGFWTTTASVLLQVIEMKGDAKDTPVDQGVDHVDHPWRSPKQSVWRPLHSREATATSPVRIVVVADIPLTTPGKISYQTKEPGDSIVGIDLLLARRARGA